MSTEEDREPWTPSTEQVRAHYVFNQSDQWDPERGKAFDRWLASVRTPAPAPADSHPAYLALDLWMALGIPSNGFDGYYERNGWADTWANLLDAVRRQSGRKECPIVADGEGCVLINGHIGPHMGASDVGSSEPLPLVGAAVSTPQDTEWEYQCRLADNPWTEVADRTHGVNCSGTMRRRRKAGPWEPVPTEGVSE